MPNILQLYRKVLRKLDFEVAEEVIRDVVQCKPYVIERVLIELRQRIDTVLLEKQQQAARHDLPESDQYHHCKSLMGIPNAKAALDEIRCSVSKVEITKTP